MNNQTKFSIRGSIHKAVAAIRKGLNIRSQISVAELAKRIGLPVVYPQHKPANFTGYLWPDEPHFIAVNSDLPAHEQSLFIARQIAFCAQQKRSNSLVLDQPWKWAMLDAAPEELREKICRMDEESRAHCIMLIHANRDEFRAYIKADYRRFYGGGFSPNVVAFHLFKLRVEIGLVKYLRKFLMAEQPTA